MLKLDQSLKNCYTTINFSANNWWQGKWRFFDLEHNYLNHKDIAAVQLVPDGIIKYTYPIEGNEKQ
jgi:hypothetical protein